MTNFTPGATGSIADSTQLLADEAAEHGGRPQSAWRLMLPTMTRWLAVGLVLVVGIVLYGLIAPLLVGDPDVISDVGLSGPSSEHLLGTTQTGQDVLSQLGGAEQVRTAGWGQSDLADRLGVAHERRAGDGPHPDRDDDPDADHQLR